MVTRRDIERRFEHHAPNDKKIEMHQIVRNSFIALAAELNEFLPVGREAAIVQTTLQEAAMWANASIAMSMEGVEE